MENLTIPVSMAIAKAYNGADFETKRKAEILINNSLTKIFSPKKSQEKLIAILNEGSEQAKANGFTPDMLDDLLKDD